jgi:hypothetical protein
MFTEEQIKGSLNSVDRKLLYDIREELRILNNTLANSSTNEPHTVQDKRRGPRANKEVV